MVIARMARHWVAIVSATGPRLTYHGRIGPETRIMILRERESLVSLVGV